LTISQRRDCVRTKENRDKTDRWLHSEVMPGMDARKGKLVVIGRVREFLGS
jgi:hypothetical protein